MHEHAIALDGRAATETRRVWIQIARVGQWSGHPSGRFSLSADTFAEIVRNFRHNGLPVPIDFEHASELDPRQGSIPREGAPAVGWIHDLDNRGSGGLWALVEWLDVARDHIRAGRYRFISPTIRFGARDRETGKPCGALLSSAGLTNQPFLTDMQPLAASSRVTNEGNEMSVSLTALNTLANSFVEKLIAEGHHPTKARQLAMAKAGRMIAAGAASMTDDTTMLAARVADGTATIVELADRIAAERHIDRNSAFVEAERMIRGR